MGNARHLRRRLAEVGAADHFDTRTHLSDCPALRHLAVALDDPGATLGDLLRGRREFVRAPDPSAWLGDVRTRRCAGDNRAGAPLSVLTYNVGLLSRRLGPRLYEVPHTTQRRTRLLKQVLTADADVIALQEVWEDADVARFGAAGRTAGYRFFAGGHRHRAHVLMILVHRRCIGAGAEHRFAEHCYAAQRRGEQLPGLGISRGFIAWSFELAAVRRRITIVDTHTTAFPPFAHVRSAQALELARFCNALPDDELLVVAGDLNCAPYYPWDRYGVRARRPVDGWWRNAISYPLLMHVAGLEDAVVRAGRTKDFAPLRQLRPVDEGSVRAPFGDGSDPDPERTTFTATDANSLYHRQYGGTEYPARIDHILLRDRRDAVAVTGAGLRFCEVHDFGAAGRFELSDHFGVAAALQIGA